MLDAHCHIDLYPDPTQTALAAERAGVFTVLVTNLPSSFEAAFPNVQQFKKLRLALGFHPLTADEHTEGERELFRGLVHKTSFIGEVGLDFSREGFRTKETQLASFRYVLQCLEGKPKFVSVHSRQAELSVLELIDQEYRMPVVFHWYTGTNKTLDLAVEAGHYFSVNPAMVLSTKGLSTVQRIPAERMLTESDGPFVKVGTRTIVPSDVQLVERALTKIWSTDQAGVRNTIMANFRRLIQPLQGTTQNHP
jgi:TatD DNase family protein